MKEKIAIVVAQSIKPKYKKTDCDCKKKKIDMRFKTGIIHWTYEVGKQVRDEQVIALAEVEKAVVEIKAPCKGTIVEICVPEGEKFKFQTILGYIEMDAS